MTCEGSETTVKGALGSVNGVNNVAVTRESDLATVEGEFNGDELDESVSDTGYDVARSKR